MIPGKINTHLFQDLTVLSKANQKGSIVYISPDKKIHSGTVFQKLKALVFKTTSSENKRSDSNLSAKNLVIENLENQLRLFVNTDGIQDQDKNALNIAITNIAGGLVDRVTDSKNSIKNDVFSELKNLLQNYQFTFNGETVKKENLERIKDAFLTIEGLNASSEKDKLRFIATQINKANEAKKEIYIEDIKSISANAAWVKKHKGVTSEKALILGKEMNRSELLDLKNNQKFNVLQKAIKSQISENKDPIKKTYSSTLKEYVNLKREKNLEQFIKTLSREERYGLNKTEMKKKLLDPQFKGLNPQGRYQAFLELKVIENNKKYYAESGLNIGNFGVDSDDNPKTPTPAQDIKKDIDRIRNEPKYQEK
jgi:hypothetical protein